jgi:hypothetical protein
MGTSGTLDEPGVDQRATTNVLRESIFVRNILAKLGRLYHERWILQWFTRSGGKDSGFVENGSRTPSHKPSIVTNEP